MSKRRFGFKTKAIKEIIESLAKRRIKVTPALVGNVKARMRVASNGRSKRAAGDHVPMSTLIEAKRLADKLSGVKNAALVFDALAQLSS